MRIQKRLFLLFVWVALLLGTGAKASHIIGGEVRYEHVSGNTYQLRLSLYGDCNPDPNSVYNTLFSINPRIFLYRDSTILVDSIALQRIPNPPRDASPTCPAYLANTRCNGGTEPGITLFEYSGTVTLPASNPFSSCWRFVFDGESPANNAGRTSAIDNIQTPDGTRMYVYSTLNNLGGRTNSSPTFSTFGTPYFCQQPGQSFNPGASDANTDDLSYQVVSALNIRNVPVLYNPGFTAPYRLATSGAPVFNTQTGQLTFNPSRTQRSVVVYLIEEYRAGVRVGSILREMTFVVIGCNNAAPIANLSSLSTGAIQRGTDITVCQGETVSFNLNPTDPQGDTIDVTAAAIPTGATYFIGNNGSPAPTSSFTWNTGPAATGTYNFYITYADRSCPIAARQTIGYSITVVPPPAFSFSVLRPAGCKSKAIFSITSPGNISQAFTIQQGGATLKTYPATTAITDSLPAGTYRIIANTGGSCTADTTVTLTALPSNPINLTITALDTPCANDATGRATVAASGGAGAPYSYQWNSGDFSTTATGANLPAGLASITVFDRDSCSQTIDITIPARPTPEINAGPDRILCVGDSLILETTGTAVNWNWSPAADLSCTTCPAPVTKTQVDRTYVVATAFANGCTAADTVSVQVLYPGGPTQVGRDTAICAGDTVLLFADGGAAYTWSPAGSLTSDTAATPGAFPQTTTTYTVIIQQNQCFADTLSQLVSVLPKPTVTVDEDFTAFSGASAQLTATATNASTISWTPTTGLNCYQCFQPVAFTTQSVTYVATVQNTFGCTASDTVRILVTCDGGGYYIANTFTPNGDGRDDWFYPQGKGGGTITRFEVYNRWGKKVFERKDLPPNNPTYGWDGTFGGKPLDAGVFTYVMEARCNDGTPVYLKGDITLMR